MKNPLNELNPLSFIQQCLELSSCCPWCKSQTKAKRKILKQWDPKNIHHRKRADIQTYIDMMLGMKLLQAATESGYPQSWACLNRHADSLCCWAPVFKPPSSRHTVVVTQVTPNLAEACCRDARIIKFYQAYLYGRRVPGLRVKSQPTGQWESRNPIWLPSLCSAEAVMWSRISLPPLHQKQFGKALAMMTSATF